MNALEFVHSASVSSPECVRMLSPLAAIWLRRPGRMSQKHTVVFELHYEGHPQHLVRYVHHVAKLADGAFAIRFTRTRQRPVNVSVQLVNHLLTLVPINKPDDRIAFDMWIPPRGIQHGVVPSHVQQPWHRRAHDSVYVAFGTDVTETF